MRLLLSVAFLIAALIPVASFYKKETTSKHLTTVTKSKDDAYEKELVRLKTYSSTLQSYIKENDYNDQYCFLVDMKINSGKKRFFIYDLKNDSVLNAGLVTHGSGSDKTDGLYFSNTAGSYCTSIGKYKIGNSYNGNFGLAYKLYGLDKTNSNAFNRFVVLHSHGCVPAEESSSDICLSQGCPTVAPSYLQTLKTYIDKSEKPVLLQIFY